MKDMKNCNLKACLKPVVLLYLFFFGYEFFVHGIVLRSMYVETAALWRPSADQSVRAFSLLRYLVMAGVLTCLFKKFRLGYASCEGSSTEAATTHCPVKSGGLYFGVKIGLLLGIWSAGCFVYLPIPSSLAVAWFLTGLFEGIGAGLILGMAGPIKTSCETK